MPTVTFAMDALDAHAERGEKVVDVALREGSSLPFGCQRGNCGTCLVKITKGREALAPPDEHERATLAIYGATDEHRLACQCVVQGDLTLEEP